MDDIRAVMDAAGSESAVLFGAGEGGFVTALFAATYPERTTGLILFNSRPRQTRSPDMPWLSPRAELEQGIGNLPRRWGDLDSMAEGVRRGMPSATEEELRQWARIARLSHSPGTAAAYLQANVDVDIREVLPSIRLPTLVMYRAGVKNAQPNARYLADRIPTARLVELPGSDMPPDWGDQEPFFAVLEGFFHDLVEGNLDNQTQTEFSPPSSSPTSLMPPRAPRHSAIAHGANSSANITTQSGRSWAPSGAGKWTLPAMVSSRRSMARLGRSVARVQSVRPSAPSALRSEPVSIRANASWSGVRRPGSQCISARASQRKPRTVRCWSPAR
jgi:hypothetical protein